MPARFIAVTDRSRFASFRSITAARIWATSSSRREFLVFQEDRPPVRILIGRYSVWRFNGQSVWVGRYICAPSESNREPSD